MDKNNTTKQPLEDKKRYVPYGINGMYYIYDNENHFMIPGQAGSSSRRMIKRKCEQLNHEENTPAISDSKEGLHTQGEELPLKIHERNGEIHIDRNDFYYHGTGIAVIDSTLPEEEQKRVADIIVKAVNERKALLDALKKIQRELDILKGQTRGDIQNKIGEINQLSVDTIKNSDPNW